MQIGTVQWFDNDKGEGMCLSSDSISYYFHYSAIQSDDKFKTLSRGDKVNFSLYENLYMKQIDKIKKI